MSSIVQLPIDKKLNQRTLATTCQQLAFAFLAFFALLGIAPKAEAQSGTRRYFAEIQVFVDTTIYSSSSHPVFFAGRTYIGFPVKGLNPVVEIHFFPTNAATLADVYIQPSSDFQIVDSLVLIDSSFFSCKIQFSDIRRSVGYDLQIGLSEISGKTTNQIYGLFPYQATVASLRTKDEEVFIGEEKVFDIQSINAENIKADNIWANYSPTVEYKISKTGSQFSQIKLHLIVSDANAKEATIPLKLNRPIIDANGKLLLELEPLKINFTARNSRTAFIGFDRKDITLEFDHPKGVEIQVDKNRNLLLKKTYRIENSAEPGGAFVGELYTRSSLSNEKILAWIRPYALHRASDGYLYIKDGDELKFITNLSILEKTSIKSVTLMHEGGDYTPNLGVQPGEKIELRIEGTGLERVPFAFEGAIDVSRDSATATDNVAVFRFTIPISIAKKKLTILKGKEPSGYELVVREFLKPRQLDFVSLNWGAGETPFAKLTSPVLYDKNVKDLIISFSPSKIDAGGKLFGKQYLSLEISIYNKRKDLVEVRKIESIVICPGEGSARQAFYDGADCNLTPINLNSILAHKSGDLEEWSTIEIVVKHKADKYGGNAGYTQKAEIILQKHVTFDVDVSFPAGLLVKKIGVKDYGNLYGISMAVLAQFNFFQPDKVNKPWPYKIGAGFIALNAFDFSQNAKRDLGMVVIGSIFPTKTGSRFSFPIYLGGGYLLNEEKIFFLLGPGIQVRL